MTDSPAYLTRDLPGIGGQIRQRAEDFIVEEQPLYQPAGEGEHCYLFIEKKELSSPDLIEVLANHFGVRERDIGMAGRKDTLAVTRQLVSIHTPGKSIDDFPMLQHDRVGILWADMHTNKLRLGHLSGNRFSIRIRNVDMSKALAANRIMQRLSQVGVPNRFGPQRFGTRNTNQFIGRSILLGTYRKRISTSRRRFYLNALQSAVFNRVLDSRLENNELSLLVPGDLAWKHAGGSVFAVDQTTANDPETRQRLDQLEISPSGPMWGASMTRASGQTDQTELDALAELELGPDDFANSRSSKLVPGVRRPLRVAISSAEVEGGCDEHGGYVRLTFDLPAGAYATAVLREIMKSENLAQPPVSP